MNLLRGRFEKATGAAVDDFHSSIAFDARLYRADILGSIAHVTMLGEENIIPMSDAALITEELKRILGDIENGKVTFSAEAEDIHMNIESILISRIGDVGKRLHTGRSRNDQIALDTRMYLRDEIGHIVTLLKSLSGVLCDIAEQHLDTIISGYTHMQKAQPVTLAHYLMAYCQMFLRDISRLRDCGVRMNVLPLGSGALAGTTFPLNRARVAELLGFDEVSLNSMDSVSDRDFAIEFISDCSVIMMHLSRFCEELVLWSSNEFSYIEMDDTYATGSSIMPQKKNPDMAELIRGKTGRVYGDLMGILSMMKSLPLAYNKDMQEDKPALFDSVDTIVQSLEIFTGMISTVRFNKDKMLSGASLGFTNATDAADYLVRKGLPFRDAHEIIGKLVLLCISRGISLDELELDEYRELSALFERDIYDSISLSSCVERRQTTGAPNSRRVMESIEAARKILSATISVP